LNDVGFVNTHHWLIPEAA